MAAAKNIQPTVRKKLNALFRDKGYTDYKWINPQTIIVSQWVRMKCMYGCGEYGQNLQFLKPRRRRAMGKSHILCQRCCAMVENLLAVFYNSSIETYDRDRLYRDAL